jgi:hypothetical protein
VPDPKFQWSKKQGRYQYKNGKPVKEEILGKWLHEAVENNQKKIGQLTQDLIDKKINVAEWATSMKDEIRAGHRMAAHLAHCPNLSRSQVGRLGAAVRAQYGYLDNFANQIENEEVDLASALILRAQMYPEAIWATWQNEIAVGQKDRGYSLYKSVLGAARHCDSCLKESDRGWVKIGELIPIGSRECLSRCRCHFEFK